MGDHLNILAGKAREAIAQLFSSDRTVFLAFSGGKESAVIAHLCEPFRGRFKLLWANTGYMFPHVAAYIRRQGERYGLVEQKSDLIAQWKAFGLPSEILPVTNALGDNCHTEPKLQPWVSCCSILRMKPITDFIQGFSGPVTLLHGQRKEDRAPGLGISSASFPSGTVVLAPLADWTTADVLEFVQEEHIELPSHYDEIPDSLDCWVCPAAPLHAHGTKRIKYMAREYPDLLRTILPGVIRIHSAGSAAVNQLEDIISQATSKPRANIPYVPQRTSGLGDCMIAAVATALGLSYEDIASALGYPCNKETGMPSLPPGGGVSALELSAPLLSFGIVTSLVMSSAASKEITLGRNLPSSDQLKTLIRGRSAVLFVDDVMQPSRQHALAWKDGRVVDCRAGDPFHLQLEDLTIQGCAVFYDAPAPAFGDHALGRPKTDMKEAA